jgi:hypothetical protein
MNNYPCSNCIVKTVCSELCDDVAYESELLKFIIEYKHCHDCGCDKLIGCGGDRFKDTRTFVDSSASCIECGSVYFKSLGDIERYRKIRKKVTTDNIHKVITFWRFLFRVGLITEREYYQNHEK